MKEIKLYYKGSNQTVLYGASFYRTYRVFCRDGEKIPSTFCSIEADIKALIDEGCYIAPDENLELKVELINKKDPEKQVVKEKKKRKRWKKVKDHGAVKIDSNDAADSRLGDEQDKED